MDMCTNGVTVSPSRFGSSPIFFLKTSMMMTLLLPWMESVKIMEQVVTQQMQNYLTSGLILPC